MLDAPDIIRCLLSAMDMQLQRESGAFHIPQKTAKYIWDKEMSRARAFLDGLDHPPTPEPEVR